MHEFGYLSSRRQAVILDASVLFLPLCTVFGLLFFLVYVHDYRSLILISSDCLQTTFLYIVSTVRDTETIPDALHNGLQTVFLSSLQIKTATFANSVDPDETARHEPFYQDLHCLAFRSVLTDTPLFNNGHVQTQRWKSLLYRVRSKRVALFFFGQWLVYCLFVCVEVLGPSQPNGVMSSAVSLPNHTFTGQA